MSYFDDASLVMIPSGYKDQKVYSVKPLDGSGDLTFSRASSATRVASNGLIEKVRTNLITYSNTFSDASWVSSAGTKPTVTQNVTDPFGVANNAWTITGAGTTYSRLSRAGIVLTTAPQTISFFVKKGTATTVTIFTSQTSVANLVFNFDTQAITGVDGGYNVIRKATQLTDGWFRLSMTLSTTSGTANETWGFNLDGSITTTFLLFGGMLENGDIATDYIPTTSAAVSVGPVSGLPRLDYLNSTCPRLLLEPQRTNLALYSEQFNNAAWVLDGDGAGQSVTANYATSPDGYQNADRIQLNRTGGSYSRIRQVIVAPSTGSLTASVYLKTNDGTTKNLNFRLGAAGGDVISVTSSWQRFSITKSVTSGLAYDFELFTDSSSAITIDFSAYGAQYEAGAYATSYIPTLSTSVTRVAESFSKSSISSLIGQTEGTFLVDFVYSNTNISVAQIFSISDSTTANRVYIGTAFGQALIALVTSGGVAQANIPTSFPLVLGQRYRAAIAYKANDFAFYLNGVQIGTDNSGTVPAMNYISNSSGAGSSPANYPLNQLLLFKTRLTNAQLAELTTL